MVETPQANPPPTEPAAPTTRVPLWVKVTLFGSLAINLVVVGLIAGAVVTGGPQNGPRQLRESVTPFTQALTKDDRRAISRELRQSLRRSDAGRQIRENRRRGHREALMLLRQETFDAARFAEVMARQANVTLVVAKNGAMALTAHLATLSAEERAAYADRVEIELQKRGGPPRGGLGPKGPPPKGPQPRP